MRCVLSAALSRNPANPVVARPEVLGTKHAEMRATPNSITRGSMVSRLANVRAQLVRRTHSPHVDWSMESFQCASHHHPRVKICTTVLVSKSAAQPTITFAPTVPTPTCPKCGWDKNTRSCCASEGAWYGICGDDGDPRYPHTWSEGVNSCIGKRMTKYRARYACMHRPRC